MPTNRITVQEVTVDRVDLLDALATVRNETVAAINPDDPPAGVDELRAELHARHHQVHFRSWVAFVDGEPAGEATFELEDDDENAHIASSDWIAVRDALRGRGVAPSLLAVALEDLAAGGRTSLLAWVPDLADDAGARLATRLGLVEVMVERCSRLRMPDLDEALVDEWCSLGVDRTDGYVLHHFGERCPDGLLAPYLDAVTAMDDMPIDDLAWSIAPTDESLVRGRERFWTERGLTPARSLVVAPDGTGAGFSELFVSRHRPALAFQGDTGVVPAHRGRALGRWLKAANLRYAQRRAPGFDVVETFNAESNPWMLDINVAMGFRPHVTYRGFQGDLDHAAAVAAGGHSVSDTECPDS